MEPCIFQPKTEKIFFFYTSGNEPPSSLPTIKYIYIYIFYILGDRTFESKA